MSEFESFLKQPEDCCSYCMETCFNLTECENCSIKLKKNSPKCELVVNKAMVNSLRDFLVDININNEVLQPTPPYCEETLSSVLLQKLMKFNSVSDIVDYLNIFNLKENIKAVVADYIIRNFIGSLVEKADSSDELSEDESSEDNVSSESDCITDSSEYFDSDTDDS